MEVIASRMDKHIDQISQVVESLKHNPDSRRIIVSAWNVGEIDQMLHFLLVTIFSILRGRWKTFVSIVPKNIQISF